MRPIPANHRKQIADDDFYRKCYVCGDSKVEIHHVFSYSGRQISEMWNYVPLCRAHHAETTPHNMGYKKDTRNYIEWCTVMKMTAEDKQKYPKFNWSQLKHYLDTLFLKTNYE